MRISRRIESFWPGRNGEIVAALQMPGSAPMWLWGAHGTGKTHLLQAVCAAAGEAAAYFPLDRALALPPEALAGFENTAVLCVDDAEVLDRVAEWSANAPADATVLGSGWYETEWSTDEGSAEGGSGPALPTRA